MKAVLSFDPNRRAEQLAFVAERVAILHELGDRVWVALTEEQAQRFTEHGIQVERHEGADLIQLPAAVFDPAEAEPAPPASLAAQAPAGDVVAYTLVQFVVAPDAGWIQAIEDLGGELVEEVPIHAAVFALTADQAGEVRTLRDFISWVGLFHPAYALSFELAGREEPCTAADLASLAPSPEAFASRPEGAARVAFFADRDIAAMRARIESAGAQIVTDTGYDCVVNVPVARVPDLLRVPGVKSLEPHRTATLANQRAGIILGANQVRNLGNVDFLTNLDGTGEIVGVVDSGLDNSVFPTPATGALANAHTDFCVAGSITASRILRAPPPPPDPAPNSANNLHNPAWSSADFAPHGTHVVGSIVGDGRNAPAPNAANPNNSVPRGMAPLAQVVFHSANRFAVAVPPPGAVPGFDPGPFLRGFQDAYRMGARVHTNSWGEVPQAIGGVVQPMNVYRNTSGTIDRYAFLNPDALVLFAAHNHEADLNNSGSFDQIFLGSQGVAKNILTIGASENVTNADGDGRTYLTGFGFNPPFPNCARFGTGAANPIRIAATTAGAGAPPTFPISDNANDIAMFSCRGWVRNPLPPFRRRVKPDLVAPGTNIMSTLPVGFPQPAQIGQVCPPFGGAVANVPNPSIPTTAPTGIPPPPPATPGYFVISGTSMATPLAAGCALLTRQFYRTRFGQMRRPLLLESLSQFVDLPAAVAHADGPVLAWVHRDAGSGQNHILAARYDRELRRAGGLVQLAANVGDHPAIALARHGDNTLLLYRDSSNNLQLTLRDRALAAVAGFGTAGTVTLAPASRPEGDRRPTVAVHDDEVTVVWFQTGTDNLVFQRFNAASGAAIDAAPANLGAGSHTSPHRFVMHTGAHWAVFWQRVDGADVKVMARFVDNAGRPLGAGRVTVLTRGAALREPHAVFDPRQGRFLLAFVSETAAERGIVTQRANADGTLFGPAVRAVALPAAASRRPQLALHPAGGFVLIWEDTSQGTHDVYFSFLDATGAPTAVREVRISDTPNDTAGFAAAVDRLGLIPIWQSSDEINSDLLGAYALGITSEGVFRAQADPATPLLAQQFYARQTLIEHGEPELMAVAQAWGGGDHYLLRDVGEGLSDDLYLVRTNADGLPDAALAPDGAVRITRWIAYEALALAWTGSRLVAGSSFGPDSRLYLLEADGRLVTTFGDNGTVVLDEHTADTIFLQIATSGAGAGSRIFVAYSRFGAAGAHTIRFTVRNRAGTPTGAGTVAPRDLAAASGTAKHGWFHLVASDAPVRLIAAWHVQSGANQVVRVNRFRLDGTPQVNVPPVPFPLTGLAGDSINAVIAPRPVVFLPAFPVSAGDQLGSRRREYGAAWQQRAPGGNWQVLFSRLGRTGRPSNVAGQFDVVVLQSATDHATDPQLVWHLDGYGLAWLQQPAAGGTHQLFFTLLDQNGQRPNLAVAGQPAALATNFAVSDAAADVQRFHLVWNGNVFRIAWTEVEGGRLRHVQRAVAVPRVAGSGRYDAPFQQPSAALVKATLINGATNIRNTPLPNFGNNPNDGYGWGRINLRQSLAPMPPVTLHVRDDGVVAAGGTVRYAVALPPETQLLRVTLAWTDPPGNTIVNRLHLRVTPPPFVPGGVRVFHGNRWQTAAGSQHLSAPINTAAPPAFEDTHPVQQVVIAGPPALPAGTYVVEVLGGAFGGSAFQQSPGQPFALVILGSGREIRTAAAPGVGPVAIY